MSGIGEGIMVAWAGFGLKIESQTETQENLTIWISVPSQSFEHNSDGVEMAGMFLARRFKKTLTEMGVKNLTVKAKVRNEFWTKEMADDAMLNMKKTILGSQY